MSVDTVLLVMLLGCTLPPLPLKWDIRGRMEVHPLNGPAWSLYCEYIGNMLYTLFIRKLSKTALIVLVAIAACFTVHRCLIASVGDIVGGWALNQEQQYMGLIRLMYPLFGGLLLSRFGQLIHARKNAFRQCSLIIIVVFSVPRIGREEGCWISGLYETFCVICIFPVIVSTGAEGRIMGKRPTAVRKFLGDISYPIYIACYPLVYIYMIRTLSRQATLAEGPPYMLLTFMGAFVLTYARLKCYDLPVYKWLTGRSLKKK